MSNSIKGEAGSRDGSNPGGQVVPQRPETETAPPPSTPTVWQQQRQQEETRQQEPWGPFKSLPDANRVFLTLALAMIGTGLIGIIGPPVSSGVSQAVRPFTATGKQESCLSHLQSLSQAMAQYAADYDDRFPPLEYQAKNGERVTWVTLLQQRTDRDDLLCPLKGVSSDKRTILSSFGYNPVLSARKSDGMEAASTVLLADRGDEHDVSLLPPFPSWPPQAKASNLDFWHSSLANILYLDGHARAQSSGDWLKETSVWGGRAVYSVAATRITAQYPALGRIQDALQKGDQSRAVRLFSANRKQVRLGSDQIMALWKQNSGSDRSDAVEKSGWRLAGLWSEMGDTSCERELNQEQSKRSQAELRQVESGSWQSHQSEWGFTIEYPAHWTVFAEVDGKYQDTFFKSGSPHIRVVVERGLRSMPAPTPGIDWNGMHRQFRRDYGSRYKLVDMYSGGLSNVAANAWVYEIRRGSEPRLKKLNLGGFHNWDSYTVSFMATAADFKHWQPVFDRMSRSFQFR